MVKCLDVFAGLGMAYPAQPFPSAPSTVTDTPYSGATWKWPGTKSPRNHPELAPEEESIQLGITLGFSQAPAHHRMGTSRASSISASPTNSNDTTRRLQNVGQKINIARRRLRDRREMAISNPPSAVKSQPCPALRI